MSQRGLSPKQLQFANSPMLRRALVRDYNQLLASYNALLAKLDNDGGVADTDYESLLGSNGTSVNKAPEEV